jgi:hypothetical protein
MGDRAFGFGAHIGHSSNSPNMFEEVLIESMLPEL